MFDITIYKNYLCSLSSNREGLRLLSLMLYEWRIGCYITSLTVVLPISCRNDRIVIQLRRMCSIYVHIHTRTHTCTTTHTSPHIHTTTHTHIYNCFVLVYSKNGYKQYLDYLFLVLNDQKLLQPITENGLVSMVSAWWYNTILLIGPHSNHHLF